MRQKYLPRQTLSLPHLFFIPLLFSRPPPRLSSSLSAASSPLPPPPLPPYPTSTGKTTCRQREMAAALNSVSSTEKMRGRERGKGRGGCACPSPHVPGAPSPLQALVVQGGVDGTTFDSGLRPELRRLTNSRRRAPPPRAHSASRGPPLLRGPERCLELFCPYTWSASAEGQTMQLQAQTILLGRWSKPYSIVVILVSLHGAAAWRGG